MRIKDLFEAPISDITHVGNWEKNSGFREQDRKLLTNPKAVQKIKSMWKYPEETMFNVILVNHPDANKPSTTEVGTVTREWLHSKMSKIASDIEPLLKDDQINIIYTNNKGSERVPMTGWIMAHRFGHAMMADRRSGKAGATYYFNEAFDTFTNQIIELSGLYNINMPSVYGRNKSLPFNGPVQGLLRNICTFKSAREHNLRNPFEAIHECLAQYMLSGKIKFNEAPRGFKYGPRNYGIPSEDLVYANRILDDLSYQMQEYFEAAIGYSEGEIYVM